MAALMPHGRSLERGYALIGLLVLLVITGLALGEAGASWSQARQREKEWELLKVGDEFRRAIQQYYSESPGLVKQYPPTLDALVKDDRFPIPKRHLRQIYVDPITGSRQWGTLRTENGITGVYSMSDDAPIKKKNFPLIYQSFEDKSDYGDWIFGYVPQAAPQQ